MMTSFVAAAWLLVAFISTSVSLRNNSLRSEEGRAIEQRLKSLKYDEHTHGVMSWDQGHVEEGTSHLHSSDVKNVRLALASGESLNFALHHSPIVDDDTEVFFNTHDGRSDGHVSRLQNDNCFYSGASWGGGAAAFHLCDRLFGLATAGGYEYLIYPTEVQTHRQRSNITHDTVYVFKRRSGLDYVDDISLDIEKVRTRLSRVRSVAGNSFVVELGLFSDAAYTQKLRQLYSPEMLETVVLTRVAKAQAVYDDEARVGYGVQIKVKLLEFWTENPTGYNYQENIDNNLKSFCDYAVSRHPYDVLGLNTGLKQVDSTIGIAYLEGACYQPYRCFASLAINDLATPRVYAHEIGHTLGLTHICPNNLENENSFMSPYLTDANLFTPCNKWQLDQFIKSGYGDCLFTET